MASHDAVLDGEVAALDASGPADFYPVLYRRADPSFTRSICFGWMAGNCGAWLSWKESTSSVAWCIASHPGFYVDHIVGHGVRLFRAVCDHDLEGVVAK